jgi:hypothetical protein
VAQGNLKLEIEMRMFWISKNKNWRWWKFWEPKEFRKLAEGDSIEDELNTLDEEFENCTCHEINSRHCQYHQKLTDDEKAETP